MKKQKKKLAKNLDCGRVLWIWIGFTWVKIAGGCTNPCTEWYPPRDGTKIFEIAWTPCLDTEAIRRMSDCPGGYCYYDGDDAIIEDGCKDLGCPHCDEKCEKVLGDFGGLPHFELCPAKTVKKKKKV